MTDAYITDLVVKDTDSLKYDVKTNIYSAYGPCGPDQSHPGHHKRPPKRVIQSHTHIPRATPNLLQSDLKIAACRVHMTSHSPQVNSKLWALLDRWLYRYR